MTPIPAIERFWRMVHKDEPAVIISELGPCWIWCGSRMKNGYAAFNPTTDARGRRELVHRYAYEAARGRIPAGLHIDHLCRNRQCVNPAHLEPVTQRVNNLRGRTIAAKNANATHCPSGHPYDPKNTYRNEKGHRRCRECHRLVEQARRASGEPKPPRFPHVTFRGKTQSVPKWAAELGFDYQTLAKRLKHGWGVEEAFTTPTQLQFKRR